MNILVVFVYLHNISGNRQGIIIQGNGQSNVYAASLSFLYIYLLQQTHLNQMRNKLLLFEY